MNAPVEPLSTLLPAGCLTLFAVVLLVGTQVLRQRPGWVTAIAAAGAVVTGGTSLFVASEVAWLIASLAALALLAVLLLPSIEPCFADQRVELGALLLLGAAGAVTLATSSHLVALLVGVETLSLASVVLIGLCRGTAPVEAAFKYFMLASVSVAAAAFGIALHALATGSFEVGAAAHGDAASQQLARAAAALITLGFAFELAVVPYHFAALGPYRTAAPGVAGFLMALSKVGAVVALARLAAAEPDVIGPLLVLIGVVSILWGTLGALAQRDLRGALAYSAIAHGGFLAFAVGAAGLQSAFFYALVYAATILLTFAALGGLGEGPIAMDRIRTASLGRGRSLALAFGLLSLAGMPPTPGFWAKLAILGNGWDQAGWLASGLAVTGAVVGALYYLKPVPELLAADRGAGERAPVSVRLSLLGAAGSLLVLTALPYLVYRQLS